MFFLNLTAAEFLTLFGALGGLITALYLLDRAKRRRVVSTLRFWVQAGASDERQSRRKMRDPWSLVLQLLGLILLLLALSRVQWGSGGRRGHDHVLLLDTSSWTAAPAADSPTRTVLDREKDLLRRYLATLPRTDRALLAAVDGLASPLTRFTADRRVLLNALETAGTSSSALNLHTALAFARQAETFTAGAGGEVVYTGPAVISDPAPEADLPNLRVLPVPADRADYGIRRLTVQQLEDEPNAWQALIVARNYSPSPHAVNLSVHYGAARFTPRHLQLPAGGEATAEYSFTTRSAAEFTAFLSPGGSLAADDQASVFVPQQPPLSVSVYTDRPRILEPLLASDRRLIAQFHNPSEYNAAAPASVVVLDQFAPAMAPEAPALWINPPPGHLPVHISSSVTDALLTWRAPSALESGLPAKQLRVPSAHVFETAPDTRILAAVPAGPVVIAQAHFALIGFDPAGPETRFELSTPLLFADLLAWLDPSAFRSVTLSAETVGLAHLPLDSSEQNAPLTVTAEHGVAVPFTRRAKTLQLFVDHPSTITVASAERERILSLRLPEVATHTWTPPAAAAQGLPPASYFLPPAVDLWKWLALAAAACLLCEWFFFGPSRRRGRLRPVSRAAAPEPEQELVSR